MLEIDGALALAGTLGRQVTGSCKSPCSSSFPFGGIGLVRAAYQLPGGARFGVEGGYLGLRETLDRRAAQITGPAMRASDSGAVSDAITASGLLLGASLLYRRGDAWTLTARAAFGAYLATVTDDRDGTFTTSTLASPANASYSVGVGESHGATFLYVAPEVRLGRRFGDHLELSAGLQLFILAALNQPSWVDQTLVLAAPPQKQGDGVGGFGAQTLTGSVIAVVARGLARATTSEADEAEESVRTSAWSAPSRRLRRCSGSRGPRSGS